MVTDWHTLQTQNISRHSGAVYFATELFKGVTKKRLSTTTLLFDQAFSTAPHDASVTVGMNRRICIQATNIIPDLELIVS
jgi:hypothetical protein